MTRKAILLYPKWLLAQCRVCGETFEYWHEIKRMPITCGRYCCLEEAFKRGYFKKGVDRCQS